MDFRIAPSILAADFLHLEKDVRLVNECGDVIHLDVMDGSLVPNISFGFSVIDQLAGVAEAPMDAHLMVVHPERWFEKIASEGVAMCSFHLEAAGENTSGFLARIRSLGMKAGVAINPDVPVERLYPYIGQADYFLIMSVFAGFGGQKFIGGIKQSNISQVRAAGVNLAVAGSAVYGAENPAEAIRALREA